MNPYSDIIDVEYPPKGEDRTLFGHPRMSVGDRAKIFAPFAALKGYEDAIDESTLMVEDYYRKDGHQGDNCP